MGKWYGVIGYADNAEVEPGVWEDGITERPYYGDVIRNNRKLQNSGGINDDINISNQISIVADPYANQNIYKMRYVEFNGTMWKITDVDVQYPRLVLSIGGVWNGDTDSISE
ncbi:MAG: hypothetical protein ACI4TD_08490 [Phocaeicola sp.]